MIKIKSIKTQYTNFYPATGVCFDVETLSGEIKRVSIHELFKDREFIDSVEKPLFERLMYLKGYHAGKFDSMLISAK